MRTIYGTILAVSLAALAVHGNPVFDGLYADPQIRLYGDTYWVFPTTSTRFDEQTSFDAFSSRDMKTWTKHPRILTTNEVSWAKGAMWAPDAHEVGGKYYLFFSANDSYPQSGRREDGEPKSAAVLQGYGGIGVAVADRPEGPYRDLIGKPLIDRFWNRAQPIDQYVFEYKGEWYMVYGGWGRCNLVKLASDFKSLVAFEDGAMWRDFTPKGYVEGSVLFERKGRWYFMYSSGSWTGDDYCINYSVADSPFGPFEFRGNVLGVQRQIATGAGHHSVVCIPETDDWRICYHRRPIPNEGRDHRVVCIDRMEFDPDGDIKPVVMTSSGDTSICSVEEGCADCTEAFQKRLDAGGEIRLSAGTYAVSKPLLVKGGTTVVGEPGRTRIRMDGNGNVFKGAGRIVEGKLARESGFTFRNLVVEVKERKNGRHAIALDSVENVFVECVETIGLGGLAVGTVYRVNTWDKTPDPCVTAGMVGDESLSSNIVVSSCHFDGGSRDAGMCGVVVRYATDCEVRDCLAMNLDQGFQFWGGDSFHERGGLLKNDKRCKRVKVERCRAIQIKGGGVWGSMAEDFLVTNCTAQLCADVGIDFEGSHRCEAVDCTVLNCGNGNYATFMYCLGDVAFRRCKSILNQGGICHYFNSNSTLKPAEQHVLFEGCTFTSAKPTLIRVQSALAEFKFVGNKCNNVLLDTRATNMGRVICERNTFDGARGNLEEVMWPDNQPGAPAGDRPPRDK